MDSSALVKLFVREEGSEGARILWESASLVTSSRVVWVEGFAALAAARRARRLGPRALALAKLELESRLEEIDLIELEPGLARHAGVLAERHRLGALDAIHVASAVGRLDSSLVVATWDQTLRRAAGEAGLDTAPAHG